MSTIRYHHQIIHTGKAFASTDSRSSGGVNWIPVEPPMRSLMFVSTESGLLEKCNEKRDANCTASSCITVENGWLRWSSPRKLDVGRFSLSHYSGHTWHAGSTQKTKAPRARILTCEAQSECREWVTPPPQMTGVALRYDFWAMVCTMQGADKTEEELFVSRNRMSSGRHEVLQVLIKAFRAQPPATALMSCPSPLPASLLLIRWDHGSPEIWKCAVVPEMSVLLWYPCTVPPHNRH